MMMDTQASRAAFDALLARTHVQHALLMPDGRHNEIPSALATLLFLNETPDRLQATYDAMKDDVVPWGHSPVSIADEETKARFLGDVRFQRAFMTYFSMEHSRFAGNAKALAIAHLFAAGETPLLCGLFSGVGRPLALLSDGIELRAAVLVMESLTLAAVDRMEPFYDLLTEPSSPPPLPSSPPRPSPRQPSTSTSTSPSPSSPFTHLQINQPTPEEILSRLGYDGRLSGIMKAGPGFHSVSHHVLSNPAARGAVAEYLRALDISTPSSTSTSTSANPSLGLAVVLQQLAALSALLACATHKPGRPAFDVYLARLVTCVNSVRVVVEAGWAGQTTSGGPSGGGEGEGGEEVGSDGNKNAVLLVRALWLLVLLVYITQLRPVVDGRLLVPQDLATTAGQQEGRNWEEAVFGEAFRGLSQRAAAEGRAGRGGDEVEFLRVLRSLRELEKAYGEAHGRLYYHAARKLVREWRGWTGRGLDREVMLNIRL